MTSDIRILCQCGHPLEQHANGTCNPSRPGFCECSSPQGVDIPLPGGRQILSNDYTIG